MKYYPCYMMEDKAMPPDQGFSWQCVSFITYLRNKISGKKRVRIDWYTQFIPLR